MIITTNKEMSSRGSSGVNLFDFTSNKVTMRVSHRANNDSGPKFEKFTVIFYINGRSIMDIEIYDNVPLFQHIKKNWRIHEERSGFFCSILEEGFKHMKAANFINLIDCISEDGKRAGMSEVREKMLDVLGIKHILFA